MGMMIHRHTNKGNKVVETTEKPKVVVDEKAKKVEKTTKIKK
mgnify:CR=1 FL=1